MEISSKEKMIHFPTLVAITIVVWALVNMLHEIVGHAFVGIILGIQVKAVSTTTVFFAWDQIESIGEYRIIHAGGTVVNLLTGAYALILLHRRKDLSSAWRYFLWLFAAFSSIIVVLNLVSAPLIGGGDWIEILDGLEPEGVWKTVIIGTGLILAAAGYILPLRLFLPNLKGQRLLQLAVTLIPVVVMIVIQSLSLINSPFAKLPPERNHLVASVFAYFHFILWVIFINTFSRPRSPEPAERIRLPRSNSWLVAGLVVFLFYVAILGPGIGSFEGDRRLDGQVEKSTVIPE